MVLMSCSVQDMAMNAIGNALGGDGTIKEDTKGASSVFLEDSDSILIGDALPFTIKMYEALLSMNDKHIGMNFTTGMLFVMYANAYIELPNEKNKNDLVLYTVGLNRAKMTYYRGRNLILKAIDLKYEGFKKAIENNDISEFLAKFKKEDSNMLYWLIASYLSPFKIDTAGNQLNLLSTVKDSLIPILLKINELDPDYGNGSLDELMILYYSLINNINPSHGLSKKEIEQKIDYHYKHALNLNNSHSISTYETYVPILVSRAIKKENDFFNSEDENGDFDCDIYTEVQNLYNEANGLVNKALVIDIDKYVENRLMNIMSRDKLLNYKNNIFDAMYAPYKEACPVMYDYEDDYKEESIIQEDEENENLENTEEIEDIENIEE